MTNRHVDMRDGWFQRRLHRHIVHRVAPRAGAEARSALVTGRQKRAFDVNYFPVFFNLAGQNVLVVGGGDVGLRKVALLERTGASITVIAPRIHPELMARAAAGTLKLGIREFVPADLDGTRLVIVATSHRAVNRWIATLSESRGIPVNVVDDREASRFIVPAIIDRDPVLVAISTGGTSPVLARRLRERVEALIPKQIGDFAVWLGALRRPAKRALHNMAARRRFFEELIDGPVAQRFAAGDAQGAQRISRQMLARASRGPRAGGEVTLVGAGPGDPELLTLKALRALQDADVILHDHLVPPAVLDLARRDAARLCVGKAAGQTGSTQAQINDLLIEHARQGKRVVRLKGGDPFIFGRGGEELQALARAKIRFSVIPGVTAAAGCAAYAGIPLTHRDFAHGVTFITGHADKDPEEHDWTALAKTGTTAVFYMGLARIGHIAGKLIEHGAPPHRPAAIIAQGTLPDQRVITATLSDIGAAVSRAGVESPALLVVGDVVSLHASLAWFNKELLDEVSQSA
jgi:uroporphyrin-III C-methyltransferase / precorrin-2 dehydrogenase / sirohydrochlorin ferrochelatase